MLVSFSQTNADQSPWPAQNIIPDEFVGQSLEYHFPTKDFTSKSLTQTQINYKSLNPNQKKRRTEMISSYFQTLSSNRTRNKSKNTGREIDQTSSTPFFSSLNWETIKSDLHNLGRRPSIHPIVEKKIQKGQPADAVEEVYEYQIQNETKDEVTTLNNRANIRALMASRSFENSAKHKIKTQGEEKLQKLKEAKRQKVGRKDEIKITDANDLAKMDEGITVQKEKLQGILKNKIPTNLQEVKVSSERNEKPKMTSSSRVSKKEENKQKKLEQITSPKLSEGSKELGVGPKKLKKIAGESKADHQKRFNFSVLAFSKENNLIDPVQRHKFIKEFQEVVLKNGLQKNGRLVLASAKVGE